MRVRVGGLTNDALPMLAYSMIVTRRAGNRKLFSQMEVTDPDLLARLLQNVKNGDEIEVTTAQMPGDTVSSVLRDFALIQTKIPALASTR